MQVNSRDYRPGFLRAAASSNLYALVHGPHVDPKFPESGIRKPHPMSDEPLSQSELILYQTEDGRIRIQCRFENETLWLTQVQMAELFQTSVPNINLHLKAIYAKRELVEVATIKFYLIVRTEGAMAIIRFQVAGRFSYSKFSNNCR